MNYMIYGIYGIIGGGVIVCVIGMIRRVIYRGKREEIKEGVEPLEKKRGEVGYGIMVSGRGGGEKVNDGRGRGDLLPYGMSVRDRAIVEEFYSRDGN